MNPSTRYLSIITALLVLAMLLPFKAKLVGTFSSGKRAVEFFSLVATPSPMSSSHSANEREGDVFRAAFAGIELDAASVVVLDVETDQPIFARNETEVRSLASLTKLVTALAAERAAGIRVGDSRVVRLTPDAIAEEGDDGFRADEQFYFPDIRDAMLVRSSNDAARAITEWADAFPRVSASDAGIPLVLPFLNEMNRVAADIGLRSMYFLNPTCLDLSDERAGAYGSALDVARLFGWIIKNSPATIFATRSSVIEIAALDGTVHRLSSSGNSALSIPGIIGVKTGFTDLAGGNVVLGWNVGGRSFVIAVLGSTLDGRFTDARALYDATMANFRIQDPGPPQPRTTFPL